MKFIADSCSNFSLPAVDGEVSINTPTNSSRLLFSSLVKESICCCTLSSNTAKSFCVKPVTNCPFLSLTAIGNLTRRVVTTTGFSCPGSGVGDAVGFGVCGGNCRLKGKDGGKG